MAAGLAGLSQASYSTATPSSSSWGAPRCSWASWDMLSLQRVLVLTQGTSPQADMPGAPLKGGIPEASGGPHPVPVAQSSHSLEEPDFSCGLERVQAGKSRPTTVRYSVTDPPVQLHLLLHPPVTHTQDPAIHSCFTTPAKSAKNRSVRLLSLWALAAILSMKKPRTRLRPEGSLGRVQHPPRKRLTSYRNCEAGMQNV